MSAAQPLQLRRRSILLALADTDRSVDGASLDVQWLRQHGLTALAWTRFHKSTSLPAEILADLSRAYYVAVADTELHQRELIKVLQSLAAQNCQPVIFKGVALAFMIYPNAACRLMGDLDLWLKDEEMPLARSALEAIGYVHDVKVDRPVDWMMQTGGELRLMGTLPGQGLVEFHWSVFAGEWLQRTTCVDNVGLRQRLEPAIIFGQSVLTLAPEDALLQLVAHTAVNHQLSMSALRSLFDIVLLVRHQPFDWAVLVARAKQWRLAVSTWLVLNLCVDLLDLHEAREAVQKLAPSRFRRWLISRLVAADFVLNLQDLRTKKRRYIFLLLLIDRPRDVFKLIYRTLWPESVWLSARYQTRSSLRLRLRHFFNAMRGHI